MNAGYSKDPKATSTARRHCRFRPGDAFRIDELGDFNHVDTNPIRCRTANTASAEEEFQIDAQPRVKGSAVAVVKSEFRHGHMPVARSRSSPLMAFLIPHMAPSIKQRYIRMSGEFPRIPTSHVQKHIRRTEGVLPETWDREAAGISSKRERL